MNEQFALGHKAEAVAIEDDKIMYGIYSARVILTANTRISARVDSNSLGRKGVLIKNCTSAPGDTSKQLTTDVIYYGGIDVTVNNGVPLLPNESIVLDFRAKYRVDVYIITDQVNIQVAFCELL